ncbi:MAG: Ig-like domain-containing protein [Gemmatimonadaceae bacterium]
MHPVAMTVVHALAPSARLRVRLTTLITSAAVLLVASLGLSCSTERLTTEGEEPVTLTVSPPTVALSVGGTGTLQYTVTPSDAGAPVWSSSNDAVATVSTAGLVTAHAVGTARVTASLGTASAGSDITVSASAPPPPTVTALVVAPGSAALQTGQTQQFGATEQLSNGSSRAAAGATWTATGGVVTTSGLYTAGNTAGTFRVIATGTSGHADTSTITISTAPPPPPTVTALVVTPASASLQTGATQQFTPTEQLSNGTSRTAIGVTWSATGGTVSSSGLYTAGSTAGASYRVIATGASGHADTSAITITAPPVGGAPTNECVSPRPEWIWCDDFEVDRLNSYFEMDNAAGGFGRATTVGRNGSTGIRVRYATGQVEGGNLKLAFGRTPNPYFRPVDAGTANHREVYWRMFVRAQAGWVGGAGWKWTRAIVFANANWAEAAIGHVSSFWANDFLTNGPVRGTDEAGNLVTTRYNDFDNFTYLGQVDGSTPIYASNRVGQWYCIEAHMRLNDAGQSNGVLEFWINGNLEARQATLNFLGSFSAYAINAIFFENYWNGGSPQTQERYWDNIVVSTQRIGC